MASSILPVLHAAQAALSAYGLYNSYISITNLQQYEKKSKKAAEWSNTAADQLHKTRTTQTTGALAILASFVASLVLAARPSLSPLIVAAISTGVGAVALGARVHIGNFWQGKARVPFVEGYNKGMRKTEELRRILGWVAASWVVTGVADFVSE